ATFFYSSLPAPPAIYPLSLHAALPICSPARGCAHRPRRDALARNRLRPRFRAGRRAPPRRAVPDRLPALASRAAGPLLAPRRIVHRMVGRPRRAPAGVDPMSAFRGRVEKRDLEGGIFQLVADDGKRYTLVGSTSGLQAGAEMEIDGEV